MITLDPEEMAEGAEDYPRDSAGLPSQAPKVHQHARTAQREDQAPHARGADLSQPGQLPPPRPGLMCGDPRGVARRPLLPEHGVPEGPEERPAAVRGLNEQSLSHDSAFAQLDVHNPRLLGGRSRYTVRSRGSTPRGCLGVRMQIIRNPNTPCFIGHNAIRMGPKRSKNG